MRALVPNARRTCCSSRLSLSSINLVLTGLGRGRPPVQLPQHAEEYRTLQDQCVAVSFSPSTWYRERTYSGYSLSQDRSSDRCRPRKGDFPRQLPYLRRALINDHDRAIQSPETKKHNLSSVTKILCGAAPLSAETTERLVALFPQAHIGQGYGSSVHSSFRRVDLTIQLHLQE